MNKKEIEEICKAMALPIIEKNHFELVDVEYIKEGSNYYLRVYADKEGGITIDDCVMISKQLNTELDKIEDEFSDSYILEVSSPGLLRPIKKDKDLQKNIGKIVEFKLYRAVNNVKEFEGELVAFDNENVTIIVNEEETKFMRRDIAFMRLAFEF